MNQVHPIFSPIIESLANEHFLSAIDRVFGILDTPVPVVDDDLEVEEELRLWCSDCQGDIDAEESLEFEGMCPRCYDRAMRDRYEAHRGDVERDHEWSGATEDLQTARGER
jgi:hypothetical protein